MMKILNVVLAFVNAHAGKFIHVLGAYTVASLLSLFFIFKVSVAIIFIIAVLKEVWDREREGEGIRQNIFDICITTAGGTAGAFIILFVSGGRL